MDILISLDHFGAQERKYHIYKLSSSEIAENEHWHDYYQLCYVEKGELRHRQGEREVTLKSGDAFLIPPGFRHSISFIKKNSELYSLSFHTSIFHSGFPKSNVYTFLSAIATDSRGDKSLTVRLRVSLSKPRQIILKSLLDCLIAEQKNNPPVDRSAAASMISASLCEIAQSYLSVDENRRSYSIADSYRGVIDDCLEYIKTHLGEPIDIDVMMRISAMSQSAFYQLFQKTTGMSLHSYVNFQRIEAAKELIELHPEKTLYEIASGVGYENASTFYRNFIKRVGVSPEEYRNAVSGNAFPSSAGQ